MRALLNVPLMVILTGVGALAMLLPAVHALLINDHSTGRAFFYSFILFSLLNAMIAIATYHGRSRNLARSHLTALPATFAGLPLLLAVPVVLAVPDTSFLNAYFEMVSSLTTTGATVFELPERLPPSVHLWRALVGWMGGFFVWVTAIAILAPLNLGGFEVLSTDTIGRGARSDEHNVRTVDPRERLMRYALELLPVYTGLTALLWLLLIIAGDPGLVAITHAMSTLATSGISAVGGMEGAASGVVGEMCIFVFFIFALSRQTFARDTLARRVGKIRRDPEFLAGMICVVSVPAFLFLRHWIGAIEVGDEQEVVSALGALWGAVFSVLSFLTTTGFASLDWDQAHAWSGLPTPGLILLGLALIGGGVATTAGGVKLLRVYALYKHGLREMDKLVHPSSVGGSGAIARHIRRQGAHVAWVFFMLFALSIALVMSALALTGLSFEDCTILTVAALSTTGPLADVAGEAPVQYATLSEAAKMILAGAMVLGRLETLAIIALMNPEFWRQ
ncbi:TrkH family potassium uptake protein [Actibacterium sp. XHP0104]|uniref:TrkH family potassium uptake protein n=1 Tax=Actibacterium sp. XHP0104 TaxID=2984335 RepID=UPI0021E889E0|nr:potassium transporter TrkG [Actibacterium sp. XHP0104]MCV2881053.1 TrkH family potassium uptake protein [Actibacterium sp. XHP0104]